MTLSTFLILKDEALTVARAINSVLDLTDQFVIGIDDKSSYATEQIVRDCAQRHTEKDWDIYKFTWENHFARARNRAIERCTGDWIFQIDGHEYLRSGSTPMLRWYMENTDPKVWLVSVAMHLEPDRYGIPEIFFVQHHLWRNGNGIRYVNASHNAIPLDIIPDHRRLRTNDIVIVHQRPPANASARRRQRREMNIPNFQQALEDTPDDPRSLFYIAQSFLDAGQPAEAIPFYERYLQVSTHYEEQYEAAVKLGEIQALEGDRDKAADAFHLALRLMPTRAEAPFNLGLIAKARIEDLNAELLDPDGSISDPLRRQHYLNRLHAVVEEASRWFRIAADIPPPVTSYFLRGPVYTYLPHLELARLDDALYRYTGLELHLQRARRSYARVLDFRPGDPEILAARSALDEHHISRVAAALPPPPDDRPRLLVADSTGQFTPPLVRGWLDKYHLRTTPKVSLQDLLWADLVFVEWCDENLIYVSRRRCDAPVIARLWRYEAYSDFPNRVCWDNVDRLVVPADFLRTWLCDRFDIPTPISVIHPGLDLDRYAYRPRKRGPNVAVVSYLNPRKNLDEIADVIVREPLVFHIAGRWQDPCLERHFWWKIRRLGAADRVHFHGWQDDIDSWLDRVDANFLLSASWSESFGFAIAEAMAKGIRPVVKRFEGAEDLWHPDLLYDHPDELHRHFHIADYDSPSYRDFIADRYSLHRELAEYESLFQDLIKRSTVSHFTPPADTIG